MWGEFPSFPKLEVANHEGRSFNNGPSFRKQQRQVASGLFNFIHCSDSPKVPGLDMSQCLNSLKWVIGRII